MNYWQIVRMIEISLNMVYNKKAIGHKKVRQNLHKRKIKYNSINLIIGKFLLSSSDFEFIVRP